MSGEIHKNLVLDEIHASVSRVYADITARDADSTFNTDSTNINKMVRIDSPVSYYVLTAITPTWIEFTSTTGDEWTELTDTPGSISANLAVQGNSGGTALEFGQALDTTDSPTFANITVPGNVDGRDVSADGLNVDLNTTHRSSDGKNHADVVLNNAHRVSSGVDHSFIDQDVTVTSNPQFASLVLTGDLTVQGTTVTLDATTLLVEDKNIELGNVAVPTDVTADFGGITLLAGVDGNKTILWLNSLDAWQFNQSIDLLGNVSLTGLVDGRDVSIDGANIDLNTAHRSSDGSDHTFIDQSVTTLSTPTFLKAVIGTTVTPDGTLHVHTGSAGLVSASSVADALVVEAAANNGISILTPDASLGRLLFGTPSDNFGAFMVWSFSGNDFAVGTSKVGASFRLTSDQENTNLTLSGGPGSELATFAKDVAITGALSGLTQLTVDNIDINGNTISAVNINGDLILDAFTAGTGVVKVTDQLEIAGFTSQLLLTDTDNDKTFIVKNNLGDFSITEVGGNNSFKILGGAAVNSLKITANQVEIGTRLDVDNLRLDDNTISSTDINGNINLSPNGTGSLAVSTTAIIGSTSLNPDSKLHVTDGIAGSVTAFVGTIGTFESSGNAFLSLLTPDAGIRGILFGQPSSNTAGGIFYNDPGSPDGFQFRANGGVTKMVIESDGAVGIGTTNPDFTSILDLSSTTEGFLPPRMTTAQRDAIVNPAPGLEIHNTTVGKPEVFTGISWKTVLTDDLANVTVQETFASTNVRFFGELALPAAQGWTDTATGISTIDLVTQTVFGEVKQVVRHNDDTTGGATTSKILLTAQNWIDINNFGASYSGTARLDTTDGGNGFFSGLQANAAENPLATGNRRYGILFTSDAGNLKLIEADNNPGNSVTMDGTGGNPLVLFDEWFKWECVVPAGLGAAQVYINGILTTFVPLFIVNGGGLGTQIIVSSGSTAGANRIVYHDNFGVTIFEAAATKTLSAATMAADVAQINIPEGKRDYTIILPDGNPRFIGVVLRLVANNVGGLISLENQNPAVPEVLYNGLRTLVLSIAVKQAIEGINTVNLGNVYIGFQIDSKTIGSIVVGGNTTATVIATINTFVDLDLGGNVSEEGNTEGFTLTNTITGELRYDGNNPVSLILNGLVAANSVGGTQRFNFRLLQNGSPLPSPDNVDIPIEIGATLDTTVIHWPIQAVTGDLFRLQVENADGTSNITIDTLKFAMV